MGLSLHGHQSGAPYGSLRDQIQGLLPLLAKMKLPNPVTGGVPW
jgi:hypothetical protein